MVVDLAVVKQHLRIDGDAEDVLLQLYMAGAESDIRSYIAAEDNSLPGEDTSPIAIDEAVQCAFLLVVGDIYENREAQTAQYKLQDNPTVVRLLQPHRKRMGV